MRNDECRITHDERSSKSESPRAATHRATHSPFVIRRSSFSSVILRACQFEFNFPRPAMIMGIVNVTPDSFSDGGQFLEPRKAVAHALRLIEEGAEIIDIGGESTRPRAVPVTETEELQRIMPVVEQLAGQVKVPVSVDTMKPGVARAALAAGASIVNDIAANRPDESM